MNSKLCQQCGIEPRKPQERYCVKCGKVARAEARRKAWEMTPNPITNNNEMRGRKCRPVDQSPRTDEDFPNA